MALAALGSVAALGFGSRAAEAASDVSPFAGSWSGTWAVAAAGHYGTFDWTISDQGRITGSVHSVSGNSGTIAGHVGADGSITMLGYVPSDAPESGANGYPFQGTAAIDEDGTLVASMTGSEGSGGNLLVATLERN